MSYSNYVNSIVINNVTETDDGWVFEVLTDRHLCKVTLKRSYYQKLTNGQAPPETLIHKSFEFLLEREAASNILSEFDLPAINNYFPEYETDIKKRL